MSKATVALAVLATLSIVAVAALALAPGPLYAAGLLDLGAAFAVLFDIVPGAGIAAIAVGLLCLAAAVVKRLWAAASLGALACLVGAGAAISIADLKRNAALHPLHDVTTDLDTPPVFEKLTPRRYSAVGADSRAAYPHPDWRATHGDIYPDLKRITLNVPLEEALQRARAVAEAMGWTIEASGKTAIFARIEAVDDTGWFGFRDDIAVEMVQGPGGVTVVDARSVSRIGISDLGENARRLREFLDRMESELR